jgi:hypothetical protein
MPEQSPSPIAGLLSEFSTRLRDIEERQRLIKDRTLLIGENLVSVKGETIREISKLKIKTDNLEKELERMKEALSSLISESKNFARKSELEILQRQFKMFQPLLEKGK